MAKKPYIIITVSPKGGVGKTIVSINVAAALRSSGYDVLLVDTDVENPSVGLLLGSGLTGQGYADVLKKEANLKDILILYPSSGFYYLTAGSDGQKPKVEAEQVNRFYTELQKTDFDFIIIDTPPGFELGAAMKTFDEALIVTTPEETAVRGAQRLSEAYTKYHLLHKLVINRVKGGKYQLGEDAIEKLYGDVAYAMVPEEGTIDESEAKHTPAYLMNRTSLFSLAIDGLCRAYRLRGGEPDEDSGEGKGGGGGIRKFFGLK